MLYRGDHLELVSQNSQSKHLYDRLTFVFALKYFLKRVKYISLLIDLDIHYLGPSRSEEGKNIHNLLDDAISLEINIKEHFIFSFTHPSALVQIFKDQLLNMTFFTTIEESSILFNKSHSRNVLISGVDGLV